MAKYAEYIKQIEIDSLWGGRKHIVWDLDPKVNVLSGINGVGKSTILNKVVRSINGNGDIQNHMLKGVRLILNPDDATHIRFDIIRSLDSNISQTLSEDGQVYDEDGYRLHIETAYVHRILKLLGQNGRNQKAFAGDEAIHCALASITEGLPQDAAETTPSLRAPCFHSPHTPPCFAPCASWRKACGRSACILPTCRIM